MTNSGSLETGPGSQDEALERSQTSRVVRDAYAAASDIVSSATDPGTGQEGKCEPKIDSGSPFQILLRPRGSLVHSDQFCNPGW